MTIRFTEEEYAEMIKRETSRKAGSGQRTPLNPLADRPKPYQNSPIEAKKVSRQPSDKITPKNGLKMAESKQPHKYRAQKTEVDGITFASKREAAAYLNLKTLESMGKITDLKLQVPFQFTEAITASDKPGCLLQPRRYIADFAWMMDGKLHVGDAKGMKTWEYKRKKKWMRKLLGIEIIEL